MKATQVHSPLSIILLSTSLILYGVFSYMAYLHLLISRIILLVPLKFHIYTVTLIVVPKIICLPPTCVWHPLGAYLIETECRWKLFRFIPIYRNCISGKLLLLACAI